MARYIDADKADVRSIHSSYMGYSSWADVLEWLQSQPTADVVEVVRCKDCKHQEQCCEFIMISAKDKNLDFCSYGERRTDNDL